MKKYKFNDTTEQVFKYSREDSRYYYCCNYHTARIHAQMPNKSKIKKMRYYELTHITYTLSETFSSNEEQRPLGKIY